MEKRKLTKADLDKVRNIEGFPIGRDEDIIALSDAPYYTACPNPFIEEFIAENGTPYDEETDEYHREPFAADVSEGKNDPIYNAHSYHTKVPYRAIMRYLLHYTKPGDIVYDGFCGTGMTGVAAQMCGSEDPFLKATMQESYDNDGFLWGKRYAVLNDLSPAATFIAHNYTQPVNPQVFLREANNTLDAVEHQFGSLYETIHIDQTGKPVLDIFGKKAIGRINYTILSDVLICPSCSKEFVYWDVAIDHEKGNVLSQFKCPHCGYSLKKNDCDRKVSTFIDKVTGDTVTHGLKVPVLISYIYEGKKYYKTPDSSDIETYETVRNMPIPGWVPNVKMMNKGEKWGDTWRAGYHFGITHVHHFFTDKNLIVLSALFEEAEKHEYSKQLKWLFTSVLIKTASKLHNIGIKNGKINLAGQMPNSLYISSTIAERNLFELLRGKIKDILPVFQICKEQTSMISCGDAGHMPNIPSNTIDYVFTDPPFGDNLMYSELSFIWEAWLGVTTNNENEAIIAQSQGKNITRYTDLMTAAFSEYYRVLKPDRWITVEFHNSKNAVWNALQESLQKAGFIVSDVRTIDKQQGSKNQMTSTSAVQQDLVISAYKPKDSFVHAFLNNAGNSDSCWAFITQHLEKLPVVVVRDNKIEIAAERQAYLLFDRMVAYHIVRGIPIPLDASDFYIGLDERYMKRDGMYFLPDQVNEYDTERVTRDVESVQLSFAVTNEKTAIQWLYYQLAQPQTYSEIQPKFMQEIKTIDRYEDMPELMDLLLENFIQDDKERWYVPDVTKEADVAKLREKKLLREFEGYLTTKGKLRLFRIEAIRAGFAKLWADKNYKLIVETAERLPEQIIQEDDKLLMYYDISLGRV